MTIYIASKIKHAPRWRALRASGVPIISTWIDVDGEPDDYGDLWVRCIEEASSAHATVVYVERDEVLKGAFAEMGAALGHGKPVLWVGPEMASVTKHPRVQGAESLDWAMQLATSYRHCGPGGWGPEQQALVSERWARTLWLAAAAKPAVEIVKCASSELRALGEYTFAPARWVERLEAMAASGVVEVVR